MTGPVLEVTDLGVTFGHGRGRAVRAVHDVSLRVAPGRTLAVVGESGSGKTTLARAVCGLQPYTEGTVRFLGSELRPGRVDPRMQMVFQDPYGSLHPRIRVGAQISGFWRRTGVGRDAVADRLAELLHLVGLDVRDAHRFPHEFSGGQRQRIGIARALAADPALLICDEPVSALDVSIQAQIINLLSDLRDRLSLSYLFISHDLHLVRRIAEDVIVMYRGEAVEAGPVEQVFDDPQNSYTRELLAATPRLPE